LIRLKRGWERSNSSTASRIKGSAEKLFDNLDFQRAVQAYLMVIPAVSQAANRDAIRTLGPVNTVGHVRSPPVPHGGADATFSLPAQQTAAAVS
jgi:hypothetical protein